MIQRTPFLLIAFALLIFLNPAFSQSNASTTFKCVVLGSGGGIEENNLSAYLLASKNSNDFICLDAGTVYTGIAQAEKMGNFNNVFVPSGDNITKTAFIFRELIKGYLISHAHLDHVAGLVIASPALKHSNIYGSAQTIDFLKNNIFDWETWPNFTDDGSGLKLNVLSYKTLIPKQIQNIENTGFKVTSFMVSHQEPYTSTAFLIDSFGNYVLYLGDTGADEIEGSGHLGEIWNFIAPIIREGRLSAIFMECSYPDQQPETQLFGHLTPKLFFAELENLAKITDMENFHEALRGIPVIVTGIKPSWKEADENKYLIYKQLLLKNKLGVKIIIPEQGQLIEF
ncbi:MAG: 3',5'-cyclic-nucleotide phosphodiesterase [Bacteroidales bacterium]|nr:3',5'-cyclic-nucleotide phosphodiesterase [Bacteroidales bacterium]